MFTEGGTVVKNPTSVVYVTNHFHRNMFWMVIPELTLELSHTSAIYVKEHSLGNIICNIIQHLILEKGNTCASYVTKHLSRIVPLRAMQRSIVEKDHLLQILLKVHVMLCHVMLTYVTKAVRRGTS